MLGAVLTGLVIVLASLVCGQAVMLASGRGRASAVAPAAGLSALLVVCGVAVKLPGHAVTAAVAAGIAVGVSAWALLGRRGDLGPVRVGVLVVVVGAALATAIPFAASGRIGILGQGLVNDDMASHLLFTEWLDTRVGDTPELVDDGYPLGPHALVAAAAKVSGAGLIEAFAGLSGAIAVLTALTAYAALGGPRPLLRAPASVLVAFTYLGAAYLAQGAFKEPMLALAVIGFALALPPLRGGTRRAAIPAGVIAAGTIYNYSFPGLAWLVGTAVAWLALIAIRERHARGGHDLRGRLRRARPQLAVIVGLPVAAAIPELVRLASFTDFKAFNPGGDGANVGLGNLRQALSPLEALGVWPSTEFRITPARASAPEIAFYLGALVALAVLAWGLWRALRRREAALPAALAAGALGYLGALVAGTPYTQAKALAIVSPVVMLIGLRGLLRAEPVEGEERERAGVGTDAAAIEAAPDPDAVARRTPLLRWGLPALGAAFVAAAAFSSLLPLRQAAVGPEGQVDQLVAMRPVLEGERVLFLGRESFVAWELIGAQVYAPIVHNYNVVEVPSLYRALSTRAKFDFDVVPVTEGEGEVASDPDAPDVLDDFDWVITTSSAQQSEAPAAFEPVKRTRDYVLWRRRAPIGPRRTLVEPTGPGTTVDCSTPEEGALTRLHGTARVFRRRPVAGNAWEPDAGVTNTSPGTEELLLTPGSWEISLQYAATQPLRIVTPDLAEPRGLEVTLEPNLLFRGAAPSYPVGRIEVPRRGLVHFEVSIERPPLAGRLLGAQTRGYLGPITATPVPAEETIPLSAACDRYLDWYRIAPGLPRGALDAVEAPTPRAVVES
jgi:hypothetical protein